MTTTTMTAPTPSMTPMQAYRLNHPSQRTFGKPTEEGERRRELILAILTEGPLNFRGLVSRAGFAAGTVAHHLRILKRRHSVAEQAGLTKNGVLWHLAGDSEAARRKYALASQPDLTVVLEAIPETGEVPQKHILDACTS